VIVCVYALVSRAPARLGLAGIAGEPLRLVTVDRITAVVGELRGPPAASLRNLRRYAEVVEAIAARVPAILPARFATTLADREELTFILKSRRATLGRRLRAVRGRAQMTIRLISESESRDRLSPSQTRTAGRARLRLGNGATQGTQYLQQRMAVAASARVVAGFEPLRAAVRRFVKDERVETRGGVATVNHLVSRKAADRYRTALVHAAEDNGVRLMVTGPLAPYAFADNW
jgi:hypothetical protein